MKIKIKILCALYKLFYANIASFSFCKKIRRLISPHPRPLCSLLYSGTFSSLFSQLLNYNIATGSPLKALTPLVEWLLEFYLAGL